MTEFGVVSQLGRSMFLEGQRVAGPKRLQNVWDLC